MAKFGPIPTSRLPKAVHQTALEHVSLRTKALAVSRDYTISLAEFAAVTVPHEPYAEGGSLVQEATFQDQEAFNARINENVVTPYVEESSAMVTELNLAKCMKRGKANRLVITIINSSWKTPSEHAVFG